MSQQNIDVYAPLPFKSKLDAQKSTISMSSSAPFTPSYVISSVTQSSDPTAIYMNRVEGRSMLLENPSRDSRAKKALERKREMRNREKEKRKLGLVGRRRREARGCKFDEKEIMYSQLLPLHHLWMGYMSELLNLPAQPLLPVRLGTMGSNVPPSASMHPKLLKADFHGSILTVKKSKNPNLVGASGILIHETENAFKLFTKLNKVKLIPKQNSIFSFGVPVHSTLPATFKPGMAYPDLIAPRSCSAEEASSPFVASAGQTVLDICHLAFELYGNQFRFRSSDRAGRKFKHKETIEL